MKESKERGGAIDIDEKYYHFWLKFSDKRDFTKFVRLRARMDRGEILVDKEQEEYYRLLSTIDF